MTIALGEMYPEWGIIQRSRKTRSLVDKSRFGSAGNGMRIKVSDRRRGADPPKNESGRFGTVTDSFDEERYRCVSARNDSCIINIVLPI